MEEERIMSSLIERYATYTHKNTAFSGHNCAGIIVNVGVTGTPEDGMQHSLLLLLDTGELRDCLAAYCTVEPGVSDVPDLPIVSTVSQLIACMSGTMHVKHASGVLLAGYPSPFCSGVKYEAIGRIPVGVDADAHCVALNAALQQIRDEISGAGRV